MRSGNRIGFKQNQINAIVKKLMANTPTKWGMNTSSRWAAERLPHLRRRGREH
jgi:hypothetical protein